MKRFLLMTSSVALLTANLFCSNVVASELDTATNLDMQQITYELETYLENYYEGVYTFSDFGVEYEIIEDTEAGMWINADVIVDMTLSRHPEDSPFVMGMKIVKDESVTGAEKDAVQSVIDDYLETVLPYYQVPYETAFLYRIYMEHDSNYQIYECIFDGEDRTVCGEIQQNDVHTDMLTSQDGMEYVNDKLSAANSARGSISLSGYNAAAAALYAVNHATDEPEFSGEDNSDCANFVSKCINYGGVAVDVDGDWHPATIYGNTGTCGTNWMRTGYNDNGGVIPYFLGKGYITTIAEDDVYKGCIMYFNEKSHVAIVTYCDSTTIKYSQHSNVKLNTTYYIYKDPDTEEEEIPNVTFYEFH